jgi:fused signal recognition particle receptor
VNLDSLSFIAPAIILVAIIAVAGILIFRNKRSARNSQIVAPNKSHEPLVKESSAQIPQPSALSSESELSSEQIPGTIDSVALALDVPETMAARSAKLRERLGRSQGSLGNVFRQVFSGTNIDESAWQELEDTLIMADLGASAAAGVVDRLKSAVKKSGAVSAQDLVALAKRELTELVDGGYDRSLKTDRHDDRPAVVLTVGVNGTGKTTTTGKLARMLSAQDKDVLLGAADTFRAAAAEQLMTWGQRVGVPVIRGAEGSDPASVAFESVTAGIEQEVDVVLIDTAGRLHTKQGLMDELGKVYRVAGKNGEVDEVLLVIDATTGQNGLTQAKVFSEVVPVSGVVLSKLDGTAKGGIIVAIQDALGVPVKLVGLGEGPDDLAPFNAEDFVTGLLA